MGLINVEVFNGTVTGTATSTTVSLGFTPSAVEIENRTQNTLLSTSASSGKTTSTTAAGARTTATAATTNLVIVSGGFTVTSAAADVIDYKAFR